ncbi:hypothetical protein PNEG_01824 [Pneumocystis murina B123]|uniref:RRM domain-containing protein n=1 Tax=Pneumocystis murina (strain B123) TaxID=1069680 RepID=M7NN12_PNEMU|nr:hypothetical protein PNEG_01824 [Pneumocystis murina B123]EMR10073.1 hypothetical protein PNEG_01824 [Pneumocystis murina B123]
MSAQDIKDIVSQTCDLVIEESSQKNQEFPVSTAKEAGNKIFIGNLSYKTTENDLRTLLGSIGNITAISMPVRRSYKTGISRFQGIAFVSFSSGQDAQNAIEQCNQKELLNRKITVTYANPYQTKPSNRRQRPSKIKTKKMSKKNSDGQDFKEPSKSKKNVSGISANGTTSGTQKQMDRSVSEGDAKHNQTRSSNRSGIRRAPKGPPADGINSKTTVFVAGLSYDTDDVELIEWFSAYNPQSAYVALRPLPRYLVERLAARGERRKGRGFGFVTFENEDMQNKAVEEMNDKEICGRKLTVKIAVDKPQQVQALSNDFHESCTGNTVTD